MKKQSVSLVTLEIEATDPLILALYQAIKAMTLEVQAIKEIQTKMLHYEGNTLLSVEAIVNRLNPTVTEKTVRSWFRKGFLTNRNEGGNLMCSVNDLVAFIQGQHNANEKYSFLPKRGRKKHDK